MALDLQAILNEAVSEVLEAQAKDGPTPIPNQPVNPDEVKPGKQEQNEELLNKVKEFFGKAKEKAEQGVETAGEFVKEHPYATAATGALAAGAGALGLRKLIQKRRQKKLA